MGAACKGQGNLISCWLATHANGPSTRALSRWEEQHATPASKQAVMGDKAICSFALCDVGNEKGNSRETLPKVGLWLPCSSGIHLEQGRAPGKGNSLGSWMALSFTSHMGQKWPRVSPGSRDAAGTHHSAKRPQGQKNSSHRCWGMSWTGRASHAPELLLTRQHTAARPPSTPLFLPSTFLHFSPLTAKCLTVLPKVEVTASRKVCCEELRKSGDSSCTQLTGKAQRRCSTWLK